MPEDIMKTTDRTEAISDALSEELEELRGAVQEIGKQLKKFGKKRIREVGEGLEEQSQDLVRQGRHALQAIEHRVGALEKNVEQNVRDHPGAWAGGLLGVVGFGLVLGMLARRKD